MKPSLQLRVGQQLTLTPQLQQAIKLLQLSTLDLQTVIQEQLDANLMLEVDEEAPAEANADVQAQEPAPLQEAPTTADEREDGGDEPSASGTQDIPDELPVDVDWDALYDGAATAYSQPAASESDTARYEIAGARMEQGLQAHLRWQLALSSLDERERLIAEAIIDALEMNGYLRAPMADLLAVFPEAVGVDAAEIEAVLRQVQGFDPVGIAARDAAECLTLQLAALPPDTPCLDTARRVVRDYLEPLAHREHETILQALWIDADELDGAIAVIRSLTPHPGAALDQTEPEYVVPDVLVKRTPTGWRVELNPHIAPKLRINAQYAGLVQRGDHGPDNACLRNHLQEARGFIKNLHGRNETLLKVATAIVERQQVFFERGEEALVPLVLRDIAEAVDMHESTISRVTTQKYLHTPRGVYEFKYFFSSQVGAAGGERSATAIRAMIRKLCAQEPPDQPLSDGKIVTILGQRGVQVARRTVAKYREALNIPPYRERKRLV